MSRTLIQTNPHLKKPLGREEAMRISAASSSAVEGIRKPFAAKPAARNIKLKTR